MLCVSDRNHMSGMDVKRSGELVANNRGIHLTCKHSHEKKREGPGTNKKIHTRFEHKKNLRAVRTSSPTCQQCIIRVFGRTPSWQTGQTLTANNKPNEMDSGGRMQSLSAKSATGCRIRRSRESKRFFC